MRECQQREAAQAARWQQYQQAGLPPEAVVKKLCRKVRHGRFYASPGRSEWIAIVNRQVVYILVGALVVAAVLWAYAVLGTGVAAAAAVRPRARYLDKEPLPSVQGLPWSRRLAMSACHAAGCPKLLES